MTTQRQPAISRKSHPAEDLPERPAVKYEGPGEGYRPPAASEGFSATHNTRIRPSVKARLRRAVPKLQYDLDDRGISEASLTDKALAEYLDRHNL